MVSLLEDQVRIHQIDGSCSLPDNIFVSKHDSVVTGIADLFKSLADSRAGHKSYDSAIWIGSPDDLVFQHSMAAKIFSDKPLRSNAKSLQFHPCHYAGDLLGQSLTSAFKRRSEHVSVPETKTTTAFMRQILHGIAQISPRAHAYSMWQNQDRHSKLHDDYYMHIDLDISDGTEVPGVLKTNPSDLYRLLVNNGCEGTVFADRREWSVDGFDVVPAVQENQIINLWQAPPWSVSLIQAHKATDCVSIHGTPRSRPDLFAGRYRQVLSLNVWAPL